MSSGRSLFWTTVARKVALAVTGIGLFLFVCGHLAGNLLLFVGPRPFNLYSDKLISLGVALYVIEGILLAAFLLHLITGIMTALDNRKARGSRYEVTTGRGDPSKMTVSSKTMIWTGLVLLVFIPIHILNFKYGPGIAEGYYMDIDGNRVRDLYRLVVESFQSPLYVAWYVAAMVLLGFHIRHGFWSALQSLGVHHPRLTPVVYSLGVVVGVILGIGFLLIPVWFFLGGSAS